MSSFVPDDVDVPTTSYFDVIGVIDIVVEALVSNFSVEFQFCNTSKTDESVSCSGYWNLCLDGPCPKLILTIMFDANLEVFSSD